MSRLVWHGYHNSGKQGKEIGIRKALGASVTSLIVAFTNEMVILVAIANIIAAPLSYFILNNWLENFAYRTDIGITIFILSALITLLVSILTISYRAVKAALANPVKSLRAE